MEKAESNLIPDQAYLYFPTGKLKHKSYFICINF